MNKLSTASILTGIVLLLIQIFLLKNVQLALWDKYVVMIFVYPLALLLLPIGLPRSALITMAFIMGMVIDIFYDSLGIHTASFVFTAFMRSFVLRLLEPRGGYRIDYTPELRIYGPGWFLSFVGIMMFLHCFVFFSIDAFTFVYFDKILVNSIFTFFVSYIVVILYKVVFR